jgi:UV DNA damage endonuclease
MLNLGYCCINNTLRNNNIYSSRTCIRRNFNIIKVSQLALQNVKDILSILDWNTKNNINTFRIGSEPIPRYGDQQLNYNLKDLPDYNEIINTLKQIGNYITTHKLNISFHPGQFVCLGSPLLNVKQLGIYALERENEIIDIMGNDNDIPINIHVGGTYNDFTETSQRFLNSFQSLSQSLRKRIVIENDDKESGWSIKKLIKYFPNIPITLDLHHWLFSNEMGSKHIDDSFADFLLAYNTWNNRSMQIHYSESANDIKLIPSHSDYYKNPLPKYLDGYNCHIHLEAKAKELALIKLRKDFYGCQ